MIYKVIELDKNHQQSKCRQEGNKKHKNFQFIKMKHFRSHFFLRIKLRREEFES